MAGDDAGTGVAADDHRVAGVDLEAGADAASVVAVAGAAGADEQRADLRLEEVEFCGREVGVVGHGHRHAAVHLVRHPHHRVVLNATGREPRQDGCGEWKRHPESGRMRSGTSRVTLVGHALRFLGDGRIGRVVVDRTRRGDIAGPDPRRIAPNDLGDQMADKPNGLYIIGS